MAFSEPDYQRLNSDKNLMVKLAPTSGATGVQEVGEPLQAEVQEGGTGGFINASPSISWNDYDFGMEDSERTSDPSLADDSNFEDFGQENYGGGISFYMPDQYDDNSNTHSLVYDLTDQLKTALDVITRIDGEKNNVTRDLQDGDFVSVYRTVTGSDEDSDTGSDAIRRTVGFLSRGSVAPFTIVGEHVITTELGTNPWEAGTVGRIRGIVQDRDYTNALTFRSTNADVVSVYSGGFYEVTGDATETAEIIIEDRRAGTSTTVAVTVT